jgi:DNA mismatch repair protein MutL
MSTFIRRSSKSVLPIAAVYSLLLGSIRKKFLATDLTAKIRSPLGAAEPGAEAADVAAVQQHRRELVDWAKGALATVAGSDEQGQVLLDLRFERPPGAPLEMTPARRSWAPAPTSPRLQEAGEAAGRLAGHPLVSPGVAPADARPARSSHLGFQIHNRYLVTENEEGMVVIDQHALHERILYEQLREKVLAGDMETQRLLVPEPVPLPPAEAAAALEAKETLAQLGIEVEPFGGDTVLVSSYPAMLANISPAEILRQIVEELVNSSKQPERRDLVDELLHMIACKAAIKAGDRWPPRKSRPSWSRGTTSRTRTTALTAADRPWYFSREELDRRFKRT